MNKVYTRYIFAKNFTPAVRNALEGCDLLEIAFQIKWTRVPPEPLAGFPLTRYEIDSINITEIVEIFRDGTSQTWKAKDLPFKVVDDLVDLVDTDMPQHILDSAEDDYESSNMKQQESLDKLAALDEELGL